MKNLLLLTTLLFIVGCQSTKEVMVDEPTKPEKVQKETQPKNEVETTKPKKMSFSNLEEKTIYITAREPHLLDLVNELKIIAPKVNWIPVEFIYDFYNIDRDGQPFYIANYLVLDIDENNDSLDSIYPKYLTSDEVKNGDFRGTFDNGTVHGGSVLYVNTSSFESMKNELPFALEKYNRRMSNEGYHSLKMDHIYIEPDIEVPMLKITNERISLVDISSKEEILSFGIKVNKLYNNETKQYDWECLIHDPDNLINEVFLQTFHFEDRDEFQFGYLRTYFEKSVDGLIEINEILKNTKNKIGGTKINSIQILLNDGVLLSYPYAAIPKIREFNKDYYDSYEKYLIPYLSK